MHARLGLVAPILGFLIAAACGGTSTSQVSGGDAGSGTDYALRWRRLPRTRVYRGQDDL